MISSEIVTGKFAIRTARNISPFSPKIKFKGKTRGIATSNALVKGSYLKNSNENLSLEQKEKNFSLLY